MCGIMGTPNLTAYCSSKFAITGIYIIFFLMIYALKSYEMALFPLFLGLMDSLQEELRYGGQNPNIKCTRIHPYTVDTGLALKPRVK